MHVCADLHEGGSALTDLGVARDRRTPTFTLWSPECVHPASQPPTLTLYTHNTPDSSPQPHHNLTPRPKGLVTHAKPTARFHLLTPPAECPSCGGSPKANTPKAGLMQQAGLHRLLGGSTRSLTSLASLSSCSTTRGDSVSSGEDCMTVEELQSAITAALFAYADASNLHVSPVSPSMVSEKNARSAALLTCFFGCCFMCL